MYSDLQQGDIILIRGRGWLADGICRADYSKVSHVGLVTGLNPPQVTEALIRVKTNPIEITLANCQRAWRMRRIPDLTDGEKAIVVWRALKFSADGYAWPDLLLQLGDAITRTRWFTSRFGPKVLRRARICSFIVGHAYEALGIFFDKVDDWSCTPNDIMIHGELEPAAFNIVELPL